jgi:hypothetical protein
MIYSVSYVLGREKAISDHLDTTNFRNFLKCSAFISAQLPFTTKSSPRKNNTLSLVGVRCSIALTPATNACELVKLGIFILFNPLSGNALDWKVWKWCSRDFENLIVNI